MTKRLESLYELSKAVRSKTRPHEKHKVRKRCFTFVMAEKSPSDELQAKDEHKGDKECEVDEELDDLLDSRKIILSFL